jgi:hypothetical protein
VSLETRLAEATSCRDATWTMVPRSTVRRAFARFRAKPHQRTRGAVGLRRHERRRCVRGLWHTPCGPAVRGLRRAIRRHAPQRDAERADRPGWTIPSPSRRAWW